MNIHDAMQFIHSVDWKGSVPGLSRMRRLLSMMGNPEKGMKFIHIAGTNGKGSTAAMLASVLQAAGYRTGLYTSPYIYRFNERIRINHHEISDPELAEITAFVKPYAESMEDSPTEFELVCCIAFEYFRRMHCDIVVLEVGMGGELDATNVIEVPEAAVITNIGLDHTDYLGATVEAIAQTKCGILKPGGRAVVYRNVPEVEAVIGRICAQRNVSLTMADFSGIRLVSKTLEGQTFDLAARKNLFVPLLGNHQLKNAAVTISVIDLLRDCGWDISEENLRDGLRSVRWPGRFEVLHRDPLFIIDGGHNPQCIEALIDAVTGYLAGRRLIALTGVLADKDFAQMFRPILSLIHQFICITPPSPRRLPACQLAEYLNAAGANAHSFDSIDEGVRAALNAASADAVILCFGSLYSLADIRNALESALQQRV
ncbi:MAG: folylpolyglutamate synthase/dihydrofolate synthase family protein [Christensenellales bacterium]|nr:folylpolyglutamate synthase/dihydrofolate synthase family protein [Christensenellales bacterium]